jgi:hypothetical protein
LSLQNNNIWTTHTDIAAAAERGDPKAQFTLGWYYYIGHGVTHDKSIAVEWYKRAAQKGHPEAKRLLELIQAKSDRQMISGMIIKGWPKSCWWKSKSVALFSVLALVVITSISYYLWCKNWQQSAGSGIDTGGSNQQIPIKNDPNSNVDAAIVSVGNTEPEQTVSTETAPTEPEVVTKGTNTIIETTEQKTVIDSNSIAKDPNSTPLPRTKSAFEEFTELAEKWLLELPNAID